MEESLTRNDYPENELESENKEQESNHWHRSNRPLQQIVNNSGHILEVLKAAMPYVDSRRQGTMETLMKATDLIHTTRSIPEHSAELSAASLNPKGADIEGMLYSVREVSSSFERDFIDKLLNCFKARKFYQTYNTLNQNRDLLKAASIGNNRSPYGGNNTNFMEALKSILPADQASNLDNIQMMLNTMNAMNAMGNNQQNNNPQQNYYNASPNNNQQSYARNNYSAPNSSTNSTTAASNSAPWNSSRDYNNIPNYTYQMSQASKANESPTIDSNYMNQYAPKVEAAGINPVAPSTAWNSENSAPQNNAPKMDAASMNQFYNNITNIYNALNAAGLTNGGNPASSNGNSQMNMMNTIASLAGSGLFSNNQNSTSQTNTNASGRMNTTEQPNRLQPQNMQNVPIPNANAFNQSQHQTKPFNGDALYQRLSDFRQQNDWSRAPERSPETLEAASLETK